MEIVEPAKSSRMRRVVQFPLTRIVLALVFIAVGSLIVAVPARLFEPMTMKLLGRPLLETVVYAAALLAMLVSYALYVRLVERRAAGELALGQLREGVGGSLVGAAIFSLIIAVLWVLGIYSITGSNGWVTMFGALWIGLFPGISEELIFRGVLYRIIEESLGTWIALISTSVLFGFAHIANPGATVFSSVAIALEAGLLLGMAYTLTKSLWFPMGIHFAWNFVQGGVYGVNVSGLPTPSWLVSKMAGPELLSGGAFGAEASLISVVLCLGLFGIFWFLAQRRGHIALPFWVRRRLS